MTKFSTTAGKPPIVVSDEDYGRLTKLAMAAIERFPEVAEELQIELERAQVLSTATIPEGVVQMASTVEYHSDVEQRRRVTLVFPGEADIAEGRVSILTPIGVALIGLSAGQSIRWVARDGREHELTVLTVEQPVASATPTVV
ncbi:MAG: GreA/GreB family elongation factor [Xanthobacteraceae bacterium]|jgi:regulator of nucleoside diphosphate kinase|nr:GreA/GreB family elongation factor [Xanthobacteraceae bacterium]